MKNLLKHSARGVSACLLGCIFTTALEAQEKSWCEGDYMTGDWFGARTSLSDRGINPFLNYTSELWLNTTGGLDQGGVYTGLLEFGLEIDLEKAVGWKGASVANVWLLPHGQDLSAEYLGNAHIISNIAAIDRLFLNQLWFQQNLFDDLISFRVGQITADSEFFLSDYAGGLLNASFGWPAITALNLPAGGPAYPLGTLGARLAVAPADWVIVRTAVFQGNVYGLEDNHLSMRWNLNDANGLLWLSEAEFRWELGQEALPGNFKLGTYLQTGDFADPLVEETGTPNWGLYFVLESMIFREGHGSLPPGVADFKELGDQGLAAFFRASFADPRRNYSHYYFDTGVAYTGLIPTRDEDVFSLGFGGVFFSEDAMAADMLGRGEEYVVEVSYQLNLTPWLSVTPDVQYIVNPGGAADVDDSLVLGLRVGLTF